MVSEHRVLTPESVEFVYELAGLGSRMVAALVDHVIVLVVLLALWLTICFSGVVSAFLLLAPAVAIGLVTSFVIYFGYFVYFERRWNGQTPGKRMMDLRVIDDRGMNVDLFQSIMRNLF